MRIITLLFIAIGSLTLASAQVSEKNLSKETKKECKRQVRLLQKEGWSAWGRFSTIDAAMAAHYLALEQGGVNAFVIEGRGKAPSQNMAQQKAIYNAEVQYASLKKTHVEDETQISRRNEVGTDVKTDERLEQNSKLHTEVCVTNMVPTATLYRTLNNGTYEVKSLYVVSFKE